MSEQGEQRPKADPKKIRQLEAVTGMLVDKPPTLPYLAIPENSPPYVPIKEDDAPLPTEQREAAEKKAEEKWRRKERFRVMREAVDSETVTVEAVLEQTARELYNAHKEKGDLEAYVVDIGQPDSSRYKHKVTYRNNRRKDKVTFKDPTGFSLRGNKEYETAYRFPTHMLDNNGEPQYPLRVTSVIKDRGGDAISAKPGWVTISLGREADYPEGGQPELEIGLRGRGRIERVRLKVNKKMRDRAMSHDVEELDHRAFKLVEALGENYNERGNASISIDKSNYKLFMADHVHTFDGGDMLVSSNPYNQREPEVKDLPPAIIPEVLHGMLSLVPIQNLFENGQQQPAAGSKDTA